MLIWGNLQEIIVDLVGQGWLWKYKSDHWANWTMFEWGGVEYTAAPQITWIIAPIIFYIITLTLSQRYTNKVKNI